MLFSRQHHIRLVNAVNAIVNAWNNRESDQSVRHVLTHPTERYVSDERRRERVLLASVCLKHKHRFFSSEHRRRRRAGFSWGTPGSTPSNATMTR
jgi:hypothetical protein